jgi:hypothetical protein
MGHPAESLHWYARDGAPAYTVIGANGRERPTTLRDARTLGLVPSVTTIIKCAAAPGLERWKADQLMMAALTLPRRPREPEAAWLSRVYSDAQEAGRKAAESGTAIHAAVQGFYEGQEAREYAAHVAGAVEAVRAFDAALGVPERAFCEGRYGGKVDLSCRTSVLDFKTKDFGPDDKLETYDEHAMQLAAYRAGLDGVDPDARCAIVYVSRTHPGLARLIEIDQSALDRGLAMFSALVAFWYARTGLQAPQ